MCWLTQYFIFFVCYVFPFLYFFFLLFLFNVLGSIMVAHAVLSLQAHIQVTGFPAPKSGQQEKYESIMNRYMWMYQTLFLYLKPFMFVYILNFTNIFVYLYKSLLCLFHWLFH